MGFSSNIPKGKGFQSPLEDIKIIVPESPEENLLRLDACLVFYPSYFEDCPSLSKIKEKLKDAERIDFNKNKVMNNSDGPGETYKIPKEWGDLRKEAKRKFKKLQIITATVDTTI